MVGPGSARGFLAASGKMTTASPPVFQVQRSSRILRKSTYKSKRSVILRALPSANSRRCRSIPDLWRQDTKAQQVRLRAATMAQSLSRCSCSVPILKLISTKVSHQVGLACLHVERNLAAPRRLAVTLSTSEKPMSGKKVLVPVMISRRASLQFQ